MTIPIYESYPEWIELDGQEFQLDLDFRNVLRVVALRKDESWTERERAELSVKLLLKRQEDCPAEFGEQLRLLAAVFTLFPKTQAEESERYLDLDQDAGMIRSAFFRIGIDLTKDKLHYFRFLELLADLPEDTALMRTVELRRKPLPKPTKTNAEEIAALQRAKARVALQIPEEERRRNFARALKNSSNLRG